MRDPGYDENSTYEGFRYSAYPINAGTSSNNIKAYHDIKYRLEEELIEHVSKMAKKSGINDSAYLSRLIKKDMWLSIKPENAQEDHEKEWDPGIETQVGKTSRVLKSMMSEDLDGDIIITETRKIYKKSSKPKKKSRDLTEESRNEMMGFM